MAAPSDAKKLAELEAEHWRHYPEPPTLMVTTGANSADELAEFIVRPDACAWIAWQGDEMAGYIRFEDQIHGSAEIMKGPGVTGITGAYVRPAHRGRGLAPALLDAGLGCYATQGYHACSVDFESFNPEAAAFWPKYFDIATLSVTRIPEREPGSKRPSSRPFPHERGRARAEGEQTIVCYLFSASFRHCARREEQNGIG